MAWWQGRGGIGRPGSRAQEPCDLTHDQGGYRPTFVGTAGCVVSGCSALDRVTIEARAQSPTFFLRMFGVDHFSVTASGAACGPCDASPVAYDVALVLDRSYPMCTDGNGNTNGCVDLANAVTGIKTLLPFFNPTTDRVALTLLSGGDNVAPFSHTAVYPCDSMNLADMSVNGKGRYFATAGDFFDGTPALHDSWVVAPLANDFKKADGTLNASSAVVSTLNCVQHKPWTPIAPAIQAATDELVAKSRPGVTKVLVFFSDGGGNTSWSDCQIAWSFARLDRPALAGSATRRVALPASCGDHDPARSACRIVGFAGTSRAACT